MNNLLKCWGYLKPSSKAISFTDLSASKIHMKENLGGCNVKFTDVELKEFRDAIEKIEFREPETVLTDR